MKPIDYIYRFDPRDPNRVPHPTTAEAARKALEDGNRLFSRWMASCQSNEQPSGDLVIPCNSLEVGMVRKPDGMPRQYPFAAIVGCSDARVPAEMIFGQGFNDLFVIRVAGNVMGDVCQGSIDFATTALSESVKCVVVIGHRGCGAVAGSVDSYLHPSHFWGESTSTALRAIFQKIFVAVREANNGIKEVWGPAARSMPEYHDALMDGAVLINAAQTAFNLRQEIERANKQWIEVLYGVYNTQTFQVTAPSGPHGPPSSDGIHLAPAPTSPKDFSALAVQMAKTLKPKSKV